MKGWLLVNSFINSGKFNDLYKLLIDTANNQGINLSVVNFKNHIFPIPLCEEKREYPDFVLFWDKDIALANMLENAGIKVFNSALSIEICDSKALSYIHLAKNNCAIPKTFLCPKTFENVGYSNTEFLNPIIDKISFPFIIKEATGSFGQQVYLAKNFKHAEQIIKNIGYKEFIIQEYVRTSCGMDIRINIVGNEIIATMLRTNSKDFRSNITLGGIGKKYSPNKEQAKLALKAAKALNLDFCGVDILFGENGEPLICEVNSNPNFISTMQYTKRNLAEYIFKHIKSKLEDS